jgi:hypothetical protein
MCWRWSPCWIWRCASCRPVSAAGWPSPGWSPIAAPLWLLDEPFSPLDARWRVALGLLMQAHLDKGGA